MDFVYELGVLGLSVAGTVILARLAHAGRLPRLIDNDGMLAGLIGAFTVGLCFGLIGIVFKLGPILGSPLIVGDRLFIGAEEGKPNYHCFDRKTGKELWSMNMPSGCWSTAAAWNDTIIVGGNNGKLYCLDQATGKEKWVYKSGAGIWSSPSVVDGKALFGSYDRYYRMVDAETGEELWKYDMGDRSHSGAAVEDGHIWVGSASGWFYCFG